MIVREPCDGDAAREWDVVVVPLHQGLHLVHVDHYYAGDLDDHWYISAVAGAAGGR